MATAPYTNPNHKSPQRDKSSAVVSFDHKQMMHPGLRIIAGEVMEDYGHGEEEEEKEKSMDVALRDGGLVARIVQCLKSDVDRHSAAMVCKVWNEAVAWSAHKLVLRCRKSLSQLTVRLWHITDLDLSQYTDQLEDQDLKDAAAAFSRLRTLRIGHVDLMQCKVTYAGVAAFAESCMDLEQVEFSSLPCFLDAAMTVFISRCMQLRVLHLENCRSLGDEALEAIAGCRELQELSLKGEFGFTSSGLAVIGSKCGGLVKLALELGAVNIDLALKNVAHGCHRLRDVSLKYKSAKLRELSRCSYLRSLAFESYEEDRLDEAVVAIATANRNLIEFTSFNRLSDSAVIALIFKCPLLQKLHLDASDITEGFCRASSSASFLQTFYLIISRALAKGSRKLACVD